MECQQSDSKQLFKVFEASKRKRTRKKRDGTDDANSAVTDGSTSGCQANVRRVASAKASLQELSTSQNIDGPREHVKRERDSSPSVERSPAEIHRSSRSPRRHRRQTRDGLSLALKAGLVSSPRSISPVQDRDVAVESIPQDQDSFIYAFLEETIKRDKKKQRHAHRHEERRTSRDRQASVTREHRHHHRRRRDEVPSRERDKHPKEDSHIPSIDQAMLIQTLAKLCAKMTDNCNNDYKTSSMPRTQSHKSLQCEVQSRHDAYELDRRPTRILGRDRSRDNITSRIRSQEEFRDRVRNSEIPTSDRKPEKCFCCYDKDVPKYASKLEISGSRVRAADDERYRDYPDHRSYVDHYRTRQEPIYRDYDRRSYDDEKKRYFEQKASRSFEINREGYPEDEKCRRTARSDCLKEKRYDEKDKRYDKYYDEKTEPRNRLNIPNKDRRIRKNVERYERNSVASRDDDYKDRDKDRYSERERDSGLSVADGTSTISGRSNYLRVVKQEIAEQREAMDKMMKLWKELMRCFKSISQTNQGQDKAVHESAQNVKESAAAQLRLWRECMRRYETVARDVGDTDARLMEEINKQRSEMAEMASMWQECLQRYRDMSNDFNTLKQKLVTSESPTRLPAAPLTCAEGEGTIPAASYRIPPNYPPIPPMPTGYPNGSPLRTRASAPPAWWWCGEGPRDSPRRRSSPDSRGSRDRDRDRDRRHRHKDRDSSRYKEKPTKPNAARSEHRHRKR